MSMIHPNYSEFSPKDIIFGEEVHQRLMDGVKAVHDAVGATMGHEGMLVMYENISGIWPVVTKDGVSVADMIAFDDQAMNMGAQFVIQACNEQVRETGDGTTLTAVLSYKIYESALNKLYSDVSQRDVLKFLDEKSAQAINELRLRAEVVGTLEELQLIARVAINHDNELGDAIAEAVWEAGKYGMVTKERMFQEGYAIEKHDGYKLETGLQQKEFANDGIKMILENPYVLVTDKRLVDPQKLDGLIRQILIAEGNSKENMEKGIFNRCSLVIVSPTMGIEVNKVMLKNIAGGGPVRIVHVKPCQNLEPTQNRFILEDIASLTGATFISEESGVMIEKMDISNLGRCDKVTSQLKETFFQGKNVEGIKARVEVLESIKGDVLKGPYAEESLAKLTGGMVVIKVGGKNFTDQNEINDRVDDCIKSCKSAMEQGYVRGGGIELQSIGDKIEWDDLKYPHSVISSNAGVESIEVDTDVIIDPVKVLINAIKNSTSVVKSMIKTRVMILASKKEGEKDNSFTMSLN